MVMFSKNLLVLLAASMVSLAQKADIISDNPSDVVYRADFPSAFSQNVVGIIQFYSLNGTTKVHVDITGLPKNAGVFSYHIHENPVGDDGDCEATGKHFNPFGASPDCESQKDDSLCQVGDLSGKHGLINTTCFETYFYDPYLSLDPSNEQYIGNKAINIHLENLDKLACANIRPSRDPEDLVLLDYEAELEQVKLYEEITGVKIEDRSSPSDYERRDGSTSGKLDPTEVVQEVVEEIVEEIVQDEELEKEAKEATIDEESDEQDLNSDSYSDSDNESDETDLDELIYEDIEKKRSSYSSFNSTTTNNYSNASNVSGAGETSYENAGILIQGLNSFGTIGSIIVGFILAHLI